MTDLLSLLLKANLAAAAAIVLALLLRKAARKAFGARLAYALWLVVPLAVLASFLPARSVVLPYVAPLEPVTEIAVPATSAGAVLTVAPPGPLVDSASLVALWLAGAAISFAVLAWSQSRFIKSLGGVAREGKFLRARAAGAGPAVVGALIPRIVLPADFEARYNPAEQQVVLAHEAAHLAAGDAVVNGVIALARCLFWFNPLIHLAARTVRVDQELACDAAVLSAYPRMRRPYAEALLKTQIAAAPLPLGCYWPAGAANPLKERIAMLNFAPPSRTRTLCGGAGMLVLCLGAGVAAWAAQPATVVLAAAPASSARSMPTAPWADAKPTLAGTQTAQAAARLGPRAANASAPSAAIPVEMTRSSAGNAYQRIDADPAPARTYFLRVTMPDGTPKTLISPRTAPFLRPGDETEAYRAATRIYEAAREEQAARAARGAPAQPLTPELQSALDAMNDFARDLSAKRMAEIDARYDRITVTSEPVRTTGGTLLRRASSITLLAPKNLTAEAKASILESVDKQLAMEQPAEMRELRMKARDVLAARPTTD